VGARPVFVDVDPATFNMTAAQAADELSRRPKIRAILPVHLFGGCAQMDEICSAAAQYGIPVIEDAAQAIGAEYKGRRAGSMGLAGCFSFFPSKNLGAFGDGGMCTTNDPAVADKLHALRVHGSRRKYYHDMVGLNSRLDELQAAVLRIKLRKLDEWTQGRQRNAALYRRLILERNIPVALPVPAAWQTRHIYNQFVIRTAARDDLQKYLRENGVGTEVYYPVPLHLQACFANLGYSAGDFPVSEALARESLALPVFAELDSPDIEYIVELLTRFFHAGS
jgi:dTDP-4-amino-4,6-dideoxygalactose transaminase